MARPVQYAHNDNPILAADEEDSVWETIDQHAPYFRAAAKARKSKRVPCRAGDCGFNFGDEIVPQAGLFLIIPDGCIGDVNLRFTADNDLVRSRHYGRSLA